MIKLKDQHKLSYFNKGDATSVSEVFLSINYLQGSYALCDEVAMNGFHILLDMENHVDYVKMTGKPSWMECAAPMVCTR